MSELEERHRAKGNGFGFGLIEPPFSGKVTRTLKARYHKDGSEILLAQPGGPPRRLTPLECLRLMGFPRRTERFFNGQEEQPISDTRAYKCFGNSVVVPLVTAVVKATVDEIHAPF